MDDQQINVNQLAERIGAPPQTTLNDIISRQADPRLENVQKIAVALGVQAISLFTERNVKGNVHQLPGYPTISGRSDNSAAIRTRDRKKRRV